MKKRFAGMITAGVVAAALAGCQGQTTAETTQTAAAESQAGTQAEESGKAAGETEAEAKELSGSITLYTSQPEEDVQTLIDGFNEKWPDVQVDVFRSGTEEVISKVLAEKQAGSVLADVLLVADNVTFETLKEQDMLMAYESPELEGIPEAYIDKDHMYTGTKVITTGIAYNTDLVDTAPTSFADLTDPAYKDNLIMPSPLYSGAAAYNLGVITRTEGMGSLLTGETAPYRTPLWPGTRPADFWLTTWPSVPKTTGLPWNLYIRRRDLPLSPNPSVL